MNWQVIMIEKFLKLQNKSVLYSSALIEEINKHLDESTKINFISVKEVDINSSLVKSYDNPCFLQDDNLIFFDNYQKSFDISKDKIFIAWEFPAEKLKFQTFKLSNYNKLSDKVDQKIKNYIFEIVDYFKRNLITNFDGYVTFAFNKNQLYVYDLVVKENEDE